MPKFCGHFCFELSLAWKMASSKANRNSKNLKDRISEDLAQLIEHEECIWNLKHPDYKSHDTRAQAWIRVGSNLRQMYSEDDLRAWGIASGRGQMSMSGFISLTVLTRSS